MLRIIPGIISADYTDFADFNRETRKLQYLIILDWITG